MADFTIVFHEFIDERIEYSFKNINIDRLFGFYYWMENLRRDKLDAVYMSTVHNL